MNVSYHHLPPNYLAELATGGGSPGAIELLRQSQYSKHVLLLQAIAAASPATTAAYDLLARVQRADAEAAAAVVGYPAVGAWAYRTALALRGGPQFSGATPDGLCAVAAAAAIRAGLTAEIEVPVRDGVMMLPSLGAAGVPAASVATVRVTPDRAQVRASGQYVTIPPDHRNEAAGWRPLRSVLADIVVDELDPFRMPTAPHVAPTADLGPWRLAFADAWALLEQHHPAVAAAVAAVVTVVVPLAKPPHGQVSSSSPEAFGAVAMSEPPDPVDLAVTLAHETQHIKLSAVLDLVRLAHPDDGSRYYAPWREDPRPVSGLLQGAYAFLGVTAFWRHQRNVPAVPGARAEMEFARWRDATALVCETLLSSGHLTEDGLTFVGTMAGTLRPWRHEPVAGNARRRAAEESERHQARWTAQHGPVPAAR